MSIRALPPRPDLEHYRQQARELLKSFRAGDADALRRAREWHPRAATLEKRPEGFKLADAQWILAREHGIGSWPRFVSRINDLIRQAAAATGARPMRITQLRLRTDEVYACAFNADGSRVLIGAQGAPAGLWDTVTGAAQESLDDSSAGSWALKWTADERYALVGGADGSIRLWDLLGEQPVRVFEGHFRDVRSVDLSRDGRLALSASGGQDAAIRLWDVREQRTLRVIEGHEEGVYSLAFDAEARRALSGARDGTVRLWDLETGTCLQVLIGHTYHVQCVTWSTDERLALSCSRDIRLWDLEAGRCLRVLAGPTTTIRTVAWTADQRRILTAAHDGAARLWDARTGECLRVFIHEVGLVSAKLVADERSVIACDWSGGIHLWEIDT